MKIQKKVLKPAIFLAMAILVLCTSVSSVYADFGFKSRHVIEIDNAPDEYYYAYLEHESLKSLPEDWDAKIEDSSLHLDHVDEQSVKDYLKDFQKGIWYSNEYWCEHSNTEHEITYLSGKYSTDEFRLIFITMDGSVHISPVLERNRSYVYDFQTGKLRDYTKQWLFSYVLFSLLITLFLEFIVFGFFGFATCKKNTSAFLFINVATNVPFVILIYLLPLILPKFMPIVAFIVLEVIIAFVEAYFYSRVLVDKRNEHRPKRAFICGLVANIFSAICGVIFSIWYILRYFLG